MFTGRPLMMGLAPQRGGGGERDLDLSLHVPARREGHERTQ